MADQIILDGSNRLARGIVSKDGRTVTTQSAHFGRATLQRRIIPAVKSGLTVTVMPLGIKTGKGAIQMANSRVRVAAHGTLRISVTSVTDALRDDAGQSACVRWTGPGGVNLRHIARNVDGGRDLMGIG